MVYGTTTLDLSKYALKPKSQDRLILFMPGQTPTNQSYIEVVIKAAIIQEGAPKVEPQKLTQDHHEELNTVLSEIKDIKRMNTELEAQLEVKRDQQRKLEIKAGCSQIE